ncbi:hypothetical protein ABNX05_11235 [Lysinibacillus sp. M3]|uniref:Tyrosine specific protein phosphatases domain-containing protein n=1 Tax=Lysinibacillus zambalensis TaxID=3160866 RepID=A0ABV1MRQ6_9BACI
MSEAANYIPKGIASIIRIVDGGYKLDDLKYPYKNVLTISFYDIEPRVGLPSNWNYFTKSDGLTILNVFESIQDSDELVIHCHAGISRSPAIALSYAWYSNDLELENDILSGKYVPNAHVLKIMSKLLGMYEDKKKIINSYSRLK